MNTINDRINEIFKSSLEFDDDTKKIKIDDNILLFDNKLYEIIKFTKEEKNGSFFLKSNYSYDNKSLYLFLGEDGICVLGSLNDPETNEYDSDKLLYDDNGLYFRNNNNSKKVIFSDNIIKTGNSDDNITISNQFNDSGNNTEYVIMNSKINSDKLFLCKMAEI